MTELTPAQPVLSQRFGRKKLEVALAFALVYLIWGSTYLAIRISDQTMPPFLMGSIRFPASGAIMLGLAIAKHDSLKISKIDGADYCNSSLMDCGLRGNIAKH